MTSKELLYIEDVLGQAKQMQTSCDDFAAQIQDPQLKSFVTDIAQKHKTCFDQFYGLL